MDPCSQKASIVSVEGVDGEFFYVDITEEKCKPFGFVFCDKVITAFGEEVKIMGVAPAPKGSRIVGEQVLWYKKDDGFAYYFGAGNLREAGFKLKEKKGGSKDD